MAGDLDPAASGGLDVHGIGSRERGRLPGSPAIARFEQAAVMPEVQVLSIIGRECHGVDVGRIEGRPRNGTAPALATEAECGGSDQAEDRNAGAGKRQ